MKKLLCVAIGLILLLSLVVPAFADGPKVTFTAGSVPEVGGKLTVDKKALMNNGSITADMYNALLEGNVIYSWYKNGVLVQEGTGADALTYKVTQEDQGCTIYVKVSFYEDDSFQEEKKCGEAISDEILIPGPAPEILTQSLADATVGIAYYVKLECSDPNAVFSEFMGSQLAEFGLHLTPQGEIAGMPIKDGNCHINISVVGEGGGENSVSFDLTVKEQPPTPPTSEPTQPPTSEPTVPTPPATEPTVPTPPATEPTVPTPPATEPTNPTPPVSEPTQPPTSKPTDPTQPPASQPSNDKDHTDDQNGEEDFPWWGYAIIALGGIGAGMGVALIFVKSKKKA